VHHEYWGNGYATEAASAMVAYGFDELKVHRVSASLVADNAASARVLEKLGMREEGRFREATQFKGRTWDALHYAILEPEWRALGH
jgi:RimJ/RimL family protein N-acetyltransferase